jgi:hypothetical protein
MCPDVSREHHLRSAEDDVARELWVDVRPHLTAVTCPADDLLDGLERHHHRADVVRLEKLIRASHLVDHHGHQVWFAPIYLDPEMHEPAHLLAKPDLHIADLVEIRHVLRPALRENRGEDVLLVVEVVVDEAVGDTGLLGDVRNLGAVKARARENLGRRGDDPFTGLRAARSARRMSGRRGGVTHLIAPAVRRAAMCSLP